MAGWIVLFIIVALVLFGKIIADLLVQPTVVINIPESKYDADVLETKVSYDTILESAAMERDTAGYRTLSLALVDTGVNITIDNRAGELTGTRVTAFDGFHNIGDTIIADEKRYHVSITARNTDGTMIYFMKVSTDKLG